MSVLKKIILFIFYFVILSSLIVVGTWSFKSFNNREGLGVNNNNNNFMVLSYENEENTKTQNLERQLRANGYPHKIVGKGQVWDGWFGRAKTYERELSNLGDDMYVVLCDGRDVLINDSFSNFVSKSIKLRLKYNGIIFGSERHCCEGNGPVFGSDKYKMYFKSIGQQKTTNDYYYLNFGLLFGTAKELRDMFMKMDIHEGDIDQGLAVNLFYNNPNSYFLDYDQEIFSNNSGECSLEWDDTQNQYKNTRTNSFPSFLHFPGGNWECYNEMLTEK